MPEKLTDEIIDKRLLTRNIKRLDSYINSSTKVRWQCLKDNYIWEARPNKIFSGTGCPKCGGRVPLTNNEFDIKLKNTNPNVIRLESYINSKTPILMKCKIDEHQWKVRPADIISGSKCPKCVKHIPLTNEYVDECIRDIDIVRMEDVKSSREKIRWCCKIDNNEWYDSPNNILMFSKNPTKYKYYSCKKCRQREYKEKYNKIVDQSIKHRNIIRLSEFTRTQDKIKFKCNICNKKFDSVCSDVLYSKSGCPYCKLKGEIFIHTTLIKFFANDYIIHTQHVINSSQNTKGFKYKIDFVLEQNKNIIFIEYNGIQHYNPSRFRNSITMEEARINFSKQQERDKNLREYCNINNILLIEVPYWITYNYSEKRVVKYINKYLNND